MKARILESIYAAMDQLNKTQGSEPLKKAPETALFGDNGNLDSLGLISLIVAIEEQVEEDLGSPITLADDRALSQEVSPFRTVGSLVDYIDTLLKEKNL